MSFRRPLAMRRVSALAVLVCASAVAPVALAQAQPARNNAIDVSGPAQTYQVR